MRRHPQQPGKIGPLLLPGSLSPLRAGREHMAVDDVGKTALEEANGLHRGLACSSFAAVLVLTLARKAILHDGGGVQNVDRWGALNSLASGECSAVLRSALCTVELHGKFRGVEGTCNAVCGQ